MKKLTKNEKTLAKWVFIAFVSSVISTTVIDMVVLLTLEKFSIAVVDMIDFKISLVIIKFLSLLIICSIKFLKELSILNISSSI